MFSALCTQCGKTTHVPNHYRDKIIRCSSCGVAFTAFQRQERALSFSCPRCGLPIGAEPYWNGLPSPCPHCQTVIVIPHHKPPVLPSRPKITKLEILFMALSVYFGNLAAWALVVAYLSLFFFISVWDRASGRGAAILWVLILASPAATMFLLIYGYCSPIRGRRLLGIGILAHFLAVFPFFIYYAYNSRTTALVTLGLAGVYSATWWRIVFAKLRPSLVE
jgi:DNA-directed RNA polymerase subunit RPC12/RpoP